MLRKLLATAIAPVVLLGSGVASAAAPVAAPVTDCGNRDTPFSAASPLVDVLLSDQAKAVVEKVIPGKIGAMPPLFSGTTPPTFAAILDVKSAAMFLGTDAAKIAEIDAGLRTVPVTDADRVKRCARFDNEVPALSRVRGKLNVLVFEKINGFKDTPSVDAAHAALIAMAKRKGWALAFTDKGGAFNPKTLGKFDAVLWNNISGDVLTVSQRAAFKGWLEAGGAYVGIHGSAGDPVYFWDWYPDTLLGARFVGHPRGKQFQEARIAVESAHPLAKGLPAEWRMTDEWYSFRSSPRLAGATPVLMLDESTYEPNDPQMPGLVMGADHPLAWTNCIGKGRMFYSAIGHRPETYSDANHLTLLENAISWAAADKAACPAKVR